MFGLKARLKRMLEHPNNEPDPDKVITEALAEIERLEKKVKELEGDESPFA